MNRVVFLLLLPGLALQIVFGAAFIWAVQKELVPVGQLMLIYILVEIAIAASFYLFYQYWVGKPMQYLRSSMRQLLEDKDLSVEYKTKGIADVAELIDSFREMVETFDQALISIAGSVVRLEPMSRELADTNMGIHQRNIIQCNHNNDIAKLLEEAKEASVVIRASISEIEDITEESYQTINDSVGSVTESYHSVHTLADSMHKAEELTNRLHDSSQEIGAVVTMISTIAEQTNLLALNAAIEAARAGEAGRGFAVVADEVRNLSIKTQESTHQIEDMISIIQSSVDDVMSTMQKSRKASEESVVKIDHIKQQFEVMHKQVSHITTKSQSISNSIDDQKELISQVVSENQEMNIINEDLVDFTKNSAISEKDLINLGAYINQHIDIFKVSEHDLDDGMREKKVSEVEDDKPEDDIELF